MVSLTPSRYRKSQEFTWMAQKQARTSRFEALSKTRKIQRKCRQKTCVRKSASGSERKNPNTKEHEKHFLQIEDEDRVLRG